MYFMQIPANPSSSTASHDSELRVDSSHQVIVVIFKPNNQINKFNILYNL